MIFFAWILFSFAVVALAANFGRNGFAWFIISLIISPFFAGLLLLIYGKTTKAKAREMLALQKAMKEMQ